MTDFFALARKLRGFRIYAVGGWVRDRLLGRLTQDLDLVLVPQREPFKELRECGRRLEALLGARPVRSPFGTLKFKTPEGVVDLALARRERYPVRGKLPKVEPCFSLEEDLRRRDFTVNAMALDQEGRLIDPLGGRADLEARLLRVLYPGSFADDPTRAFRAVRYKHKLGFYYAPETKAEFAKALWTLPRVSFARIKHELERISELSERAHAWREIEGWGLIPGRGGDYLWLSEALGEPVAEHWLWFWASGLRPLPPSDITRSQRRLLEKFSRVLARWGKLKWPPSLEALAEVHLSLRKEPLDLVAALGSASPFFKVYFEKIRGLERVEARELLKEGIPPKLIAREIARREAKKMLEL